MRLGEKLQLLRKQRGLSQEQLAAQLTVSRQAVSKWELDETMPDTENVVQLSRLFGVTTDYLLREEVELEAQAAVQAGHLSSRGWVHNAYALSLAVCAVGLLLALGGWLQERTSGPLVMGAVIQVLGIALFELAAPRIEERRRPAARAGFYAAACWLVLPIPAAGLCWWVFSSAVRPYPAPLVWVVFLSFDLLLSAGVTAVLVWLRRRSMKN